MSRAPVHVALLAFLGGPLAGCYGERPELLPVAAKESLLQATADTLSLVKESSKITAAALLDRVRRNEALLSAADPVGPMYDDLAVATYSASALLVEDKGIMVRGKGSDRAVFWVAELSVAEPDRVNRRPIATLGEHSSRLVGFCKAISGDLPQGERQDITKRFYSSVLPRLARLHRTNLEKQGPFEEALRQFEEDYKVFEAKSREEMQQIEWLAGHDTEALAEKLFARLGSLETLATVHAMHAHLGFLVWNERWDDFKAVYPDWLRNQLVADLVPMYESIVVRRLGVKRAAALGCFRACDEAVATFREACWANPSGENARRALRDMLSCPGRASQHRALKQILAGEDEGPIVAFLSDIGPRWKRGLNELKPEVRSLFSRWESEDKRDLLWRAWDRVWGDAAKELGSRPRSHHIQVIITPEMLEGGPVIEIEVDGTRGGWVLPKRKRRQRERPPAEDATRRW